MYWDLAILAFFLLGGCLLRFDKIKGLRRSSAATDVGIVKRLHDKGDYAKALALWSNFAPKNKCAQESVLCAVLRSMLEQKEDPRALATYIAQFADPRSQNSKHASAQEGLTGILNALLKTAQLKYEVINVYHAMESIRAVPDEVTFEILAGAYALRGDVATVNQTLKKMTNNFRVISPRAYQAVALGYLNAKRPDDALATVQAMHGAGCKVPPVVLSELAKAIAPRGAAGAETLLALHGPTAPLPSEAVAQMLYAAQKGKDMRTGEKVYEFAQAEEIPLAYGAFDAMVKLYAMHGSARAFGTFDQMAAQYKVTESSCTSAISLCADPQFHTFAEHVLAFKRAAGGATLAPYAAVMKVYAAARNYDAAVEMVARVRADGLEPDAMMHACSLNFASRANNTTLADQISGAPAPVAGSLAEKLRVFRTARDAEGACAALAAAEGTIDGSAYANALDACVYALDAAKARTVLAQILAAAPPGLSVDTASACYAYTTIMKIHAQKFELAEAEAALAEMRGCGIEPQAAAYHTMVDLHLRMKSHEKAWAVAEAAQKAGLEDEALLCDLMRSVKTCTDPKFRANVLRMLDTTRVDIVREDPVTLNVVLDVLVRLKEMDRLSRVVDSVQKAQMCPTIGVVNLLIKAMSSLHRLDEVRALFHDMVEVREMQPNEITIGCYVDALVSHKLLEEAVACVNKWKAVVKGNCVVYSTLLKGCAINRDLQQALVVYRLFRADGGVPNTVSLNSLLHVCARSSQMEEGTKLFKEITALGVEPDRLTYSTLIRGFSHAGKVELALQKLGEMRERRIAPDVVTYNTLLDGCAGHDAFGAFDATYARMVEDKVYPVDYTLLCAIKRFGREGKLDKALQVAKSMPAQFHFTPSVRSMTCLLSALILNKQLAKAIEIADEMVRSGPQPDAMTFERIAQACLRAGEAEPALRFIRAALKRKVPLSADFCESAVEALVQKGLAPKAAALVQDFRAAGYAMSRLLALTAPSASLAKAPWRKGIK